jgi:homocysteine S-methyltransferase
MSPGADPARRPGLAAFAAGFAEQALILAKAGVDLIVLEMLRDVAHSEAAIDAALATGLPVWAGFSVARADGGEIVMAPAMAEELRLADIVAPVMARLVARPGSLAAVMHSEVDLTGAALDIVRGRWPGALGAYPNSGHFRMPHWQFENLIEPVDLLTEAEAWLAKGAQVIGGCCGIGPDHIRLLAERLPRQLPNAAAPDMAAPNMAAPEDMGAA